MNCLANNIVRRLRLVTDEKNRLFFFSEEEFHYTLHKTHRKPWLIVQELCFVFEKPRVLILVNKQLIPTKVPINSPESFNFSTET